MFVVGTMKPVADIDTYSHKFSDSRYRTHVKFAGQEPLVYQFTLGGDDRTAMNSAIKAIKQASEGDYFWPVLDDRYALVAIANAYGIEDIPAMVDGAEDYFYQADAEVYCLDPFFYSADFTSFDSYTIGDFSDVENNGDLATADSRLCELPLGRVKPHHQPELFSVRVRPHYCHRVYLFC